MSITCKIPNVFIWNVLLHRLSSSLFLLEFFWNWETSNFPSSTHLLSTLTKLAAVRGLNFSFSSRHSRPSTSVAAHIFWSKGDWTHVRSFSDDCSFSLVGSVGKTGKILDVDEHLAVWCSKILLFVIRTKHSLREDSPRNILSNDHTIGSKKTCFRLF